MDRLLPRHSIIRTCSPDRTIGRLTNHTGSAQDPAIWKADVDGRLRLGRSPHFRAPLAKEKCRHTRNAGLTAQALNPSLNASKIILLAEDDPDDALATQNALCSAGVSNPLVHVADGDEAIGYLRGDGRFSDRLQFPLPGILLLDLQMPRVDGFRVLSWLSIQAHRKNFLVIVLSGHGELDNIKRAYDLGANSFLIKPFHVADIHNLIKVHRQYWTLSSGPFVPPGVSNAFLGLPTNDQAILPTDASSSTQEPLV